ncbi:hypothetical protein B0A50_06561 [Salinomyces thailandicus]|uniref:Uncharacterized protein n=1 Tax=Salinomyces thailandicus TaxID=706561 RepID=A0A4U0TSF3_9PEZI|nr:hypothetical protein B0A50_06561 [Salinomyces thailandica]
MSQLSSTLREASDKNNELLSTLSQTEYAPPSLKQNTAYIDDLKSQIASTDKELKKLHETTEDERKEHLKYRDSTVKRFMHKLGGSSGKEKFASKQEKEEREFLEAWQEEREAKDRRQELAKVLEIAESNQRELQNDKTKHEQAQSELDQMYNSIFSGPTPDLPNEDQMEATVRSARDHFEQCQTQAGTEKHALEALQRASQNLVHAAGEMANAHDMSRLDMWGGGTFTDMMERDGLSKAQNSVTQALRHMDEAVRTQPAIRRFSEVTIDQGHLISDVMFDSIFTDMAQHDRIKSSEAQVQKAVQQVRGQVPEQGKRVEEAEARRRQAGHDLEEARKELQRIRAEAFERLAGGGGGPPAYSS